MQSYAELHPESFTGLRVDGNRIMVAFTDQLDQHRNAIGSRLRNPNAVILEAAAHSRRELQAIRAEIAAVWRDDPRQPLMGDGVGYSKVSIRLRPPFERLAQELHRKYGESLEITIGFKRFPPLAAPLRTNRATTPQQTLLTPHMDLQIELSETVVAPGDDVRGQIWLTNMGAYPVKIDTDSLVAGGIRRAGADQLIGWFSGALGGVGVSFRLAPEERGAIALVVGTASCEPTPRFVPSPGLYEVVARIPARVSSSGDGSQDGDLLAQGATLTVGSAE